MALPADFSKIFGSTATGGLTPIGDVNYAKGWEFVGSNPPTKNDFSYLQNLSDQKAKWLYDNNNGRLLNRQVFTSSGTYTPTTGAKFVVVEGVGGGGAGGGIQGVAAGSITCAGGGGGGAWGVLKTNASSQVVTIGSGGSGVSNGAGNNGGATSFGSLLVLPGGAGAPKGSVATAAGYIGVPGSGGDAPVAADYGGKGGQGGLGMAVSNIAGFSGAGGASIYGTGYSGGVNGASNISSGIQGTSYGCGGGGALGTGASGAAAGGDGRSGILIIWEFS